MIELAVVKAHLRVDHDAEDGLIQAYAEAAISAFELWTNRRLVAQGDLLPDPVGNALIITRAIHQGVLLLVGQWYSARESVVIGAVAVELPMATNALWRPYRWVNV